VASISASEFRMSLIGHSILDCPEKTLKVRNHQNNGVAKAEWSKAPDRELKSKVEGSILGQASNVHPQAG